MIRFVAATRTAVVVIAWLVGAPILLTAVAGPPIPDRWPTVHQVTAWLQEPLDPAYAAAAARTLAWLIWTLTAAAVCAVLAVYVRRLHWSKIIGWLPPPAQGLTAAVVGTAAITTTAAPAAAVTPVTVAASTLDTHLPPPTVAGTATTSARPATSATVTPAEHRVAEQRPPVYTVARSDWMVQVAERFLGDADRYRDIARLNPGWEHHDHRFPDHWEPGWTVILPSDAHDRGNRPHATGHLAAPAPPANQQPDTGGPAAPHPVPGNPSPDASSRSGSANPRFTPPSTTPPLPDPDGVADDPTRPSSPSTAASSGAPASAEATSASSDPPLHRHNADEEDGVDLPGGWVGLPLAAAIVAAASRVWRRRRHRSVPRPVRSEQLDDPDLRPLPAAVTRLRHAVREQAPDLLDPPAAPPTVAEYASAATDDRVLPPVGPSGADLAGLTDRIPAGGLGVTGPGAEPAARALLVAALSAGSPTDPDARGQVLIPADTLTALLGAHGIEIGPIPRLTVTPTLSEALTRIEELLIARRRQLQEYDANDLAELRAADPYHPPMPPLLLLADTPPPQLRDRLSTTLHLGAALQISAVLLGAWPEGDTVTVHADGRTTAADRPRVAVLDVPTTVQLLQVLREAHTGQPDQPNPDTVTPTSGAPAAAEPAPGQRTPRTGDGEAADRTTRPAGTPTPIGADSPAVATSGAAEPRAADPAEADGPAAEPATEPTVAEPDLAEPAPPRPALHRPVRIRLLGEPAIYDHDGSTVTGLRRHARQLLVYLAVHRQGADLPQIMEAFWPTATLRRASERLSTEVSDLRGRIRHAAGDDKIQPVINTGGRYVLNADLLDIDLWRMSDALRRAGAAIDPTDQIAALREAIEAHTGGLADGHDYDWIEQAREQIRRHGVRARLHLADLLTARDPHQAAALSQAAADLDGYNEEAARHAMRTLARIGDAAAIRARLQRLRNALHDIDEEPSGETTALAAQLQRQIAGNSAREKRPASVSTSSAGRHPPIRETASVPPH